MQEKNNIPKKAMTNSSPDQQELGDVWLELLGKRTTDSQDRETSEDIVIPTLESDPWNELLQENGNEPIDLQKMPLHVSDMDVEQILEVIQEQSDPDQPTNKDQSSNA